MRYFPVFMDLRGKTVVVIGGGEEALRKIRLLLKTEATIRVIASDLHPELEAEPRAGWLAKAYAPHLLEGASLVYSADQELNARVAADAKSRNIPVNAVDEPDISTFIVPSIVDRDPVVVAIGTEGTAPILGQGIRARVDAMLPHSLGGLARAAEALRDRVAATLPAGNRRRGFWQRFFFGDIREAFISGDSCGYHAGVENLFVDASMPAQGRVAFVSVTSDDPELLTLKAQRKLQEADVIIYDSAIPATILELARRDAVRKPVSCLRYGGSSNELLSEARAGRLVVRLSAGESALEETVAVAAEGIAIEAIPAVSAPRNGSASTLDVQTDFGGPLWRAA
ncbi:NAD(P)-dependent oxidoreductase [Aestuariivirga sp.]|jgi:uroporphyrin-III C-methyltransferase/precorrin-2 dehydrogenase/sirohydrochlorin ferrochelatase|uniref:NAD(P)-dependent oxidoreductase n=1 Tax=Aestuariivirga sp. TaxID=2650926 RepID=UPI003783E6EC